MPDERGTTTRRIGGRVARIVAGIVVAALVSACSASPEPLDAAAYLEAVRGDPARLESFLREMPKGGDLHSHARGVPYAESLLEWAVEDGLCMNPDTFALSTCSPGGETAAEVLFTPGAIEGAIDAFSMRGAPLLPPRFGHDHFFSTFDRFRAAASRRPGEVLAEAARLAQAGGTQYLELMHSFQSEATARLAGTIEWSDDLAIDHAALLPGIQSLVPAALAEIEGALARQRSVLGCGSAVPEPSCGVTIRFVQQANRLRPPAEVLAALMLGAEVAARGGPLLAVDLVGTEDAGAALSGYRLHMRMIAFLRARYPGLRVALHAGELTGAFAPPDDLTYHVTEAVRVARADRLGHGVDVRSEPGWADLLSEMARDRIAVSTQLTSNAQVLGVTGLDHPIHAFLAADVPVVLSTDDPGVSRSSHTTEFVRAVTEHLLGWGDLKRFARNSLELSFLPGESLWASPCVYSARTAPCAGDTPGAGVRSTGCDAFLRSSERAAEQWRLEERLSSFEARRWSPPPP